MPELSNSFNNGLMREEEESWELGTNDISSDNCLGIDCFPMQADCVSVSKEGQASAFKCCGDVTGRSVSVAPVLPKLYSGARPDACVATHFQVLPLRMKVSVNLKRRT